MPNYFTVIWSGAEFIRLSGPTTSEQAATESAGLDLAPGEWVCIMSVDQIIRGGYIPTIRAATAAIRGYAEPDPEEDCEDWRDQSAFEAAHAAGRI